MILYNVTVNVDNDVKEEWLSWMKNVHIPEILATGLFLDNRIFKVMVNEESGTTYSVQYTLSSIDDYERYKTEHAPRLQKDHAARYGNKTVAFRTLLELV
jgi:hypothetical protein